MRTLFMVAVGFVLGSVAEFLDNQFRCTRVEWDMRCIRTVSERDRVLH